MNAQIKLSDPNEIWKPRGLYSHIAEANSVSRTVYIAGIVAADINGKTVASGDFIAQADLVFENLGRCLIAANLGWNNVVQFTTYLCRAEDVAVFGAWRRQKFPSFFGSFGFPPNTLLIVSRLADPDVLLEVQTIAVE